MRLVSGKRKLGLPFNQINYLHQVEVGQHPRRPCSFSIPFKYSTLTSSRLFKPIDIAGVGAVQDGGLAHNNPVSLAEWESRQIWPQNKRPDVVLSLGTGTSERSVMQDESRLRSVVMDGFVPRLWRSFMFSLDGQKAWTDLLNRLNDQNRGDYYRLNVSLADGDLAIDNVKSMDDLRSIVRLQPSSQPDCHEALAALLVSSFFFELTEVPFFDMGLYHCEGVIRCRLPSHSIFDAFKNIQQTAWTFVNDTEVLGTYAPTVDRCPTCLRYRKAISIRVQHPSNPINIYMRDLDQRRRKIGGFPESIDWFSSQQYMNADFGTPYHDEGADLHGCCKGASLKRDAVNIQFHPQKKVKL